LFTPGVPRDIRRQARQLMVLASSTWTPSVIRSACEANGWSCDREHPRTGSHEFHLGAELRLVVCFGPHQFYPVPYGSVLIYLHSYLNYWRDEEYDDFGQTDFDQAFVTASGTLADELGYPALEGTHEVGWAGSPPRYRYAIWRGKSGLLVLQQGEYDLNCGEFDVSVFIHPWDEGSPTPQTPPAVWGPT
jgi:hypothetical protein